MLFKDEAQTMSLIAAATVNIQQIKYSTQLKRPFKLLPKRSHENKVEGDDDEEE